MITLWPIFRASLVPHALSVDQRDSRFRRMSAASYRSYDGNWVMTR
jgi:hypothetical protein